MGYALIVRVSTMYIVLTGDLKSSRQIKGRYNCQLKLKKALKSINEAFSNYIVSQFRIIGGDGFQGMISKPDVILDIYFTLFEKIDHPFYLGVGIGNISTPLSDFIEEIDGSAFHFSSEALSIAKRKKRWIIIRGNVENIDLIECIFNLIFDLIWGWTQRRKEIILFYRKNGENSHSIDLAAHKFKTGIRNIYKTLEVGKYSLIKYAENILEEEFKKQFKIESDMVQNEN
jgi:hypothetical protein